jgi:hypothetical protein
MSQSFANWRYPPKVQKESQSAEMKKRMSKLREVEDLEITKTVPLNDADYFEKLWNEVE